MDRLITWDVTGNIGRERGPWNIINASVPKVQANHPQGFKARSLNEATDMVRQSGNKEPCVSVGFIQNIGVVLFSSQSAEPTQSPPFIHAGTPSSTSGPLHWPDLEHHSLVQEFA